METTTCSEIADFIAANDTNKYVSPRGTCHHEGSSMFQTTSCSGRSGIRAWPQKKKFLFYIWSQRDGSCLFLLNSSAGLSRRLSMPEAVEWCRLHVILGENFISPFLRCNISELFQLLGSEGSLGMMHFNHTPFPLHRSKLTMTRQHESGRRKEGVPAVGLLGWNVLSAVMFLGDWRGLGCSPCSCHPYARAALSSGPPLPSMDVGSPFGDGHPFHLQGNDIARIHHHTWLHLGTSFTSPFQKPRRDDGFEPNLIHFM